MSRFVSSGLFLGREDHATTHVQDPPSARRAALAKTHFFSVPFTSVEPSRPYWGFAPPTRPTSPPVLPCDYEDDVPLSATTAPPLPPLPLPQPQQCMSMLSPPPSPPHAARCESDLVMEEEEVDADGGVHAAAAARAVVDDDPMDLDENDEDMQDRAARSLPSPSPTDSDIDVDLDDCDDLDDDCDLDDTDSTTTATTMPQRAPRKTVTFCDLPPTVFVCDEYDRTGTAKSARLRYADMAELLALKSLMKRQHQRVLHVLTDPAWLARGQSTECTACGAHHGVDPGSVFGPEPVPTLEEMERRRW
ncbi:hypothetical protein GGF32_000822 [Allomyces javanicus]|nr:hypothetical protein GGF32_000822 [Allomyces javanicus]